MPLLPQGTEPESALSEAPQLPAMANPLPDSAPVALVLPRLGVRTDLLRLGLTPDQTLEVPPGEPGSPAGWYLHSPPPGSIGPAVLLGHVNAVGGGPGVFAGLGQLHPGDTVDVVREDGTVAVFAVERSERYGKDTFPTEAVYGNTAGPELRLITCDGYDASTGEFRDNLVVFASLAGSRNG